MAHLGPLLVSQGQNQGAGRAWVPLWRLWGRSHFRASLRVLVESGSCGLSYSFHCWLLARGLSVPGLLAPPPRVVPFPLKPATVAQPFSYCRCVFSNSTVHSYDWTGPTQAIQENFPILGSIHLPVSAKSVGQCNFTHSHALDARLWRSFRSHSAYHK